MNAAVICSPYALTKLMHRLMMVAAEQHKIVEPRFTPMRPVHHVVALYIALVPAAWILAMSITSH